MCENTIPDQRTQFASNDIYEDAILQGIMEISVISLPDEPHKYYSSITVPN